MEKVFACGHNTSGTLLNKENPDRYMYTPVETKIASGVYVVFVSREPPPNTANRVIRDQVKSDSSSVEMKMKGLEEENSALKAKNMSQEAELIRLREEKKNLESELIRLK